MTLRLIETLAWHAEALTDDQTQSGHHDALKVKYDALSQRNSELEEQLSNATRQKSTAERDLEVANGVFLNIACVTLVFRNKRKG